MLPLPDFWFTPHKIPLAPLTSPCGEIRLLDFSNVETFHGTSLQLSSPYGELIDLLAVTPAEQVSIPLRVNWFAGLLSSAETSFNQVFSFHPLAGELGCWTLLKAITSKVRIASFHPLAGELGCWTEYCAWFRYDQVKVSIPLRGNWGVGPYP